MKARGRLVDGVAQMKTSLKALFVEVPLELLEFRSLDDRKHFPTLWYRENLFQWISFLLLSPGIVRVIFLHLLLIQKPLTQSHSLTQQCFTPPSFRTDSPRRACRPHCSPFLFSSVSSQAYCERFQSYKRGKTTRSFLAPPANILSRHPIIFSLYVHLLVSQTHFWG